MKIVAFDTETHRIRPGMVCPRPMCLSYSDNGTSAHLLSREDGIAWLREHLERACRGELYLVGHNTPYDLSVCAAEDPSLLPLIFEALERGVVKDTMIRQALIDIAVGEHKYRIERGERVKTGYDLAALVRYYFDREIDKGEDDPSHPRLRYGELEGVPISDWPEAFVAYALDDAIETWNVWQAQDIRIGHEPVPNEDEQNQAAWALRLAGIWGLRTDAERVAEFRAHAQAMYDRMYAKLKAAGIVRQDGTRDMEAITTRVEAAYAALGRSCPRTPKGKPKTSEEALSESGDADLELLAATSELRTTLSRYIPMLELGVATPMNPGWITLLETGRVAAREPNPLNPPRNSLAVDFEGEHVQLGDVRGCYAPRPGWVYVSADYDGAELRSWAQVCIDLIGFSALADALREGQDIHLRLAAEFLGIPYAEAVALYEAGDEGITNLRQIMKVPNFGLPGGMGAKRLVAAFKQVGIVITEARASQIIHAWRRTWTEAPKYLDYISGITIINDATIRQLRSGRVRGGLGYSDCANCVDYETEALTQRGWLKGDEIRLTDKLLTKNAVTGALEWQTPTRISHYPNYEGELIEFRSKTFNAVTTPDHRWLVSDREGRSLCVTSATISRCGEHKIHRTGRLNVKDAPFSDDFLELVGWVLTDGSYPKRGQTGFASTIRKMFPDRVLTADFVAQLSRRQANLLAEVMFLGDGTKQKTFEAFFTRSRSAADAFQMLLMQAGFASKVSWRDMSKHKPQSSKMGNIPKMSGIWDVRKYTREQSQVVQHQVKEWATAGKKGVWCPSVPNSYFVARRGGTSYVTGNSYFQGLTADGAKAAMWEIAKECYGVASGEGATTRYAARQSPLYGSRMVLFLHDEFILESPEARASGAAERLGEIMVDQMKRYLPDVPVSASPVITRTWQKGAKPLRVGGKLVPVKKEKHDGRVTWVVD